MTTTYRYAQAAFGKAQSVFAGQLATTAGSTNSKTFKIIGVVSTDIVFATPLGATAGALVASATAKARWSCVTDGVKLSWVTADPGICSFNVIVFRPGTAVTV